jgi:hypothetical protein
MDESGVVKERFAFDLAGTGEATSQRPHPERTL